MIQPEDLRKGNLLLFNTTSKEDKPVYIKVREILQHCIVDTKNNSFTFDRLSPINITPQILISNCGFVDNNGILFTTISPYSFFIKKYIREYYSIYKYRTIEHGDCYLCNKKYLHELQNLVYLLTTEELEINNL